MQGVKFGLRKELSRGSCSGIVLQEEESAALVVTIAALEAVFQLLMKMAMLQTLVVVHDYDNVGARDVLTQCCSSV